MKSNSNILGLATATALLAGCSAGQVAVRPDTTANIHTVAIITVSEPQAYVAQDFGNPGMMFGAVGGAVAGASSANAGKNLDQIASEAGFAAGDRLTRSLQQQLAAAGYEVKLISVPRDNGAKLLKSYDAVDAALERLGWRPRQRRVQDYHDHPVWVRAVAESIRQFQAERGTPERLLFSLHGIPQRYVLQGDPYQAQCMRSVRSITDRLGLDARQWLLTFQSRVGREPWLQPYTDETLEALARSGVRHVQVVCPGFAVDCLETLEEIAMQNRELFEENGGEKLEYVPALNDSGAHARLMWSLAQFERGRHGG